MIREKTLKSEVIVDLTGPEGNAYVLLGYAKQWSKELDIDFNVVKSEMTSGIRFLSCMQAGDYENLLVVLDKYFGDFVIFER